MAAASGKLWYWVWLVQMTVPKRNGGRAPAAQVWRKLVLVQGRSATEALGKAEAIGRSAAGDADGSLVLDGQPARAVFVGIEDAGLVDARLSDGAEVMFLLERQRSTRARKLARARRHLIARLEREAELFRDSREPDGRSPRRRGNGLSRPLPGARA